VPSLDPEQLDEGQYQKVWNKEEKNSVQNLPFVLLIVWVLTIGYPKLMGLAFF
jgi:hypothetical protein